jgi:hypothetical protein
LRKDALVQIDRAEPRDLEERRLEHGRRKDNAEIGTERSNGFEGLLGMERGRAKDFDSRIAVQADHVYSPPGERLRPRTSGSRPGRSIRSTSRVS